MLHSKPRYSHVSFNKLLKCCKLNSCELSARSEADSQGKESNTCQLEAFSYTGGPSAPHFISFFTILCHASLISPEEKFLIQSAVEFPPFPLPFSLCCKLQGHHHLAASLPWHLPVPVADGQYFHIAPSRPEFGYGHFEWAEELWRMGTAIKIAQSKEVRCANRDQQQRHSVHPSESSPCWNQAQWWHCPEVTQNTRPLLLLQISSLFSTLCKTKVFLKLMKSLSAYWVQLHLSNLYVLYHNQALLAFMQWEEMQMSKLMFYDSADIVSGSHAILFCNIGQAT